MRVLERLLRVLEWIAALLLVVIAIVSLGSFVTVLKASLSEPFTLGVAMALLDELFVLFIVIELFKVALAYLGNQRVVPVVLETVIVAAARKLVAVDYAHEGAVAKAAVLSGVIVAMGVAWVFIRRAGDIPPEEPASRSAG